MIAGLDPSTEKIGYAAPDGTLSTIRTKIPADDRGRRLYDLEERFSRAVRICPPAPRLYVIEAPALHSKGVLSTIRQAEARGVLLRWMFLRAIPFVEIAPTALKRFATGNGAADKARMVAAAVELGAEPANDDEADAYHLRRLGLLAYGQEQHRHDHELEIVASINWPNIRK